MSSPLPLIDQTIRPAILEMSAEELRAWFEARGERPFRIRQIRRWLLSGRAESFDQMSDLPKGLRQELARSFTPLGTRVAVHQCSSDGTQKLLLELADSRRIECVMIPDGDRRTACISTQVGCGMGCVFCASGINGVERNLTVGEIVEQLIRLRNTLGPDERLTHIVVMGMGEPLANLENLLAALEVAGDPEGFGIGARHITISSVGLPAKIRQLAASGKQYHLAVSLHAPNDALRTRIVPTNDKIGMAAILAAADEFFQTTGRQVTFEYVLLGGLNDDPGQARELVALLRGRKAHVNLIPFNEVEGLPYRRPTDSAVGAFVATLQHAGISVKVRKRKGADIDAACGQLRRRIAVIPDSAPEPVPVLGG